MGLPLRQWDDANNSEWVVPLTEIWIAFQSYHSVTGMTLLHPKLPLMTMGLL